MSKRTELIERLRNYRGGYDHEWDCRAAVNVIEQLEAALRASTQLLRDCWPLRESDQVFICKCIHRIAANEVALRKEGK